MSLAQREVAVRNAMSQGNIGRIKELMPKDTTISNELRAEAIACAANYGTAADIELLLPEVSNVSWFSRTFFSQDSKLSSISLDNAIVSAAKNNNNEVVCTLLKGARFSHSDNQYKALAYALKQDNTSMFDSIVRNKPVLWTHLYSLVRFAAKNCDTHALSHVLRYVPRTKMIDLDVNLYVELLQAQLEAIKNDKKENARILFNHACMAPLRNEKSFLSPVLIEAARASNSEIAQSLLEQKNLPLDRDPSNKSYGIALVAAAKANNQEIVQLLQEKKQIHRDSRGPAILEAAKNNNLEIMRLLLPDNKFIWDKHRGSALLLAVEHGNKDMVQFLVGNKNISKELRDKAVLAAVGKDNLDMVKTLLGKNISAEITRRSRGPAFLLALRKKDVELAKSLLNNFSGIIYPYQRAEALKEALESRNNELVNLLLAKNEIYDHAVNNVLSHTTNVKPNLSKSGIIESITL